MSRQLDNVHEKMLDFLILKPSKQVTDLQFIEQILCAYERDDQGEFYQNEDCEWNAYFDKK
ncbi:hypothetical protein [Bacillus safensis]|uniref:hypothetical protein n=1 Tax=Bacillus safensis TaxID=561879 RepID=UPI001BA6D1F0|nr:hypothetical protein [Bacillus safensis]MBR0640348.1 hypothetical protein [Bacillus safensis]